jgi:hypothetical protein
MRSELIIHRLSKIKRPIGASVRTLVEKLDKFSPLPAKIWKVPFSDLKPEEQLVFRNALKQLIGEVTAPEMTPVRIQVKSVFGKPIVIN